MELRLTTPVALFLFNRPDTTEAVFAEIARAKPQTLLLIGDGPRPDCSGEDELCRRARAVVNRVNWPCRVLRNFSDLNLGCKRRVAGGLDWVFSQADRAIILEDDIRPHPTLFRFFQEMLEQYQDDARIGMITGFNPTAGWKADRQQYHFSYCGSIWGWASWRRAWRFYDVQMRIWNEPQVQERIKDVLGDPELYEGRMKTYDRAFHGEIDTWDFQWSVARLAQSMLSVVPAVNLVSNIGFRADATHTKKPKPSVDQVPTAAITFPLRFHEFVAVDRDYDRAFTRALR